MSVVVHDEGIVRIRRSRANGARMRSGVRRCPCLSMYTEHLLKVHLSLTQLRQPHDSKPAMAPYRVSQ